MPISPPCGFSPFLLKRCGLLQDYFSDDTTVRIRIEKGLSEAVTDVELEMIAQTWSEHCKHKIFNAEIEYVEGGRKERIDSLFNTYIRGVTDLLCGKKRFFTFRIL